MAFIKGFETVYRCPECNENLSFIFSRELVVSYRHPIDGMKEINGYPSPCIHNGKELKADQVIEDDRPIYSRSRKPNLFGLVKN